MNSSGVKLASILALDIASRTGWAFGRPGEYPLSGSVRLAPPGASNGAIGRGMLRWLTDFITVSKPDILYYEVPLDPRHMGSKTTFKTARILLGLPFLVETIAEARGIYRLREAGVQDVRKHFCGTPRPKDKKAAVLARCRQLRWDPVDDNAADALALWDFACAIEAPGVAIATAPLFQPAPEMEAEGEEIEEIPF